MDEAKDQIVDVIKQANNILVTVKNSPSIDQLAACIALTLMINELGKHGTAVFSGRVPSVLEFLEPEKTIERNTDSLQDFIISLDKSKADKLRYKIEDTVVKIFITPYRTSISDKDLEFGQGDFNVDAVIALGVHSQDDLDTAITAHGRILHDATVTSVNTVAGVSEDLGSINWIDEQASSLSEMVAGIAGDLGKEGLVDNQVATALLTGIVAETERFGNAKTSPRTMEVSAQLLTAGANQELVATKLAEPVRDEPYRNDDSDQGGSGGLIEPLEASSDPSSLEIEHNNDADAPGNDIAAAAEALQVSPLMDSPLSAEQMSSGEAPAPAPETAAEPTAAMPAPETPPAPVEAANPDVLEVPAANSQPAPEAASAPTPDDPAKAEEQAALDLIKERKVELDDHARIQPLREQGEFLGEAPKITQKDQKPVTDEEKAASDMLESTKFALTPPTLGSALNATEDKESVEAPTAALAAAAPSDAPLLSHRAPGLDIPASATASEPEPATPAVATPPVSPAVKPEYTPSLTPETHDSPLIAPAFDMSSPVASAKPAEATASAPAAPAPDEHLIDMPLPTAAPASSSAPAAPTTPSTPVSPPPPVPPPMMPPMPQTT